MENINETSIDLFQILEHKNTNDHLNDDLKNNQVIVKYVIFLFCLFLSFLFFYLFIQILSELDTNVKNDDDLLNKLSEQGSTKKDLAFPKRRSSVCRLFL